MYAREVKHQRSNGPSSLSRVLSFLALVAGIVVVAMIVLLALVRHGQERMVFFPPRWTVVDPEGVERVDFTAPDGQRLLYYLVRPDTADSSGTVVVSFHGNADLAVWQVPWARELATRTGAVVVVAEYRGYGGLPGTPTYAGTRADALATWAELQRREGATSQRAVLHGHSLGSAVASELARAIEPRALLLESPFTSARAMAARMPLPGISLFWGAISRVHYDTRERVATLDAPVWVAHGEADDVIPASMGREVHAASRRKGALLLVRDAGHNDVREGDGYWRWLEAAVAP